MQIMNGMPLPDPSHLVLLHSRPPTQLLIDLIQLKLQTCNAIGGLRHDHRIFSGARC